MDIRKILLLCIILIFGGCFLYSATPQKTYVVANLSLKDSVEVAQAYASKRNIPISNIIAFAMPTSLEISKAEYFSKIENPLVAELVKRRAITAVKLGSKDSNGREIYSYVSHDIDFVVFCYGVPCAVRDFPLAKGEKARNGMKTAGAALDSEFSARFIDGNKFFGMLKNPLYKDIGKKKSASLYGLIPTARLDGANKADVLNIIDSAIEAERKGVAGRAYLDKSKKYKLGDDWIDLANKILSSAYFDIDVSEAPALFGCADRMDGLAYYFGWYSRRATGYFAENGFRAARGASALHIYSYSAREMRNRLFWTPALVSAGAVATFGNIYEPYLVGTHHIPIYVSGLASNLCAGDAAMVAIPFVSWQAIFVGDPLFMPFKVSLEEQMSRIEKGQIDTFSQYVVCRMANKIKAKDSTIKAINFAKKYVGKMPDVALCWKIAELSKEVGDIESARKYALMVLDKEEIFSNVSLRGLAFTVVKFLLTKEINEPEIASQKLEILSGLSTTEQYKRAVFSVAVKIPKVMRAENTQKVVVEIVELDKKRAEEQERKRKEVEERKRKEEDMRKNKDKK